ncbi:DUF421 domain-containing protein [Paenibacillus motobuensis]|uniref:DUF421 domain-containing protein n=1 Tax=Paenibacillus TaxID=44249 RepID=UPI00203E594A|nr:MULTISPECIES: DUF421 domain-containing protein [Paenibacillus]MCM3038200.1 DUF421 domain-containing protein [Paenibacillus lutimineralis]MCM3645304.1 DUF421 domain-containing protein [Paenibacillus motobuensis]
MPVWLEIIVRTLSAAFVLFLMTRLLGKRQLSQLTFFEYVTGITIGDLAAFLSINHDQDWYIALVAIVTWFFVSLGIEFLQMKSKKARDVIDSKGTVLIKDGKVLEDNLKKEKLTNEELMEQLRRKSIFKLSQVEYAVIEPDGQVNALLKDEYQPITPAHLGIRIPPEVEPQTVILDGKIMDEPLATAGLSRQWLNTELEKQGVTLDNVYVGQVDGYGQLYVDLYDDKIKIPQPQEKPLLLATLKKCQADLELFALSTENETNKQVYTTCSEQLQLVIDDTRQLLIQQ